MKMTQEELSDIRTQLVILGARGIPDGDCPLLYPGWGCGRSKMLAHIDALQEETEVLRLGEKAADKLILRGRQCEELVERLKEMLVKERAVSNWNYDGGDGIPDQAYLDEAREQLKIEVPEVEWDV